MPPKLFILENIAQYFMRPLYNNHIHVTVKAIIIACSIVNTSEQLHRNAHVFHIMNGHGPF